MRNLYKDAITFVDTLKNWDDDIIIYGAGNIGIGWAYDLVVELSQKKVIQYIDNNKAGECIHGIQVSNREYLNNNYNTNMVCIIAMSEEKAIDVINEVTKYSNLKIIPLVDFAITRYICQYLTENCDYETRKKFKNIIEDKFFVPIMYKYIMGKELNLDNPITFNEKMQWLKVNERQDILTTYADKLAVREYIKVNFGDKYLIPLLHEIDNYKDLTIDVIPNEHCIIKSNCGCHDYCIVRDKFKIDINEIQNRFKEVFEHNYYYSAREWHYKNIKPKIVIEKLLESEEGKIPNDYKLIFFNGVLQYIYCSIDREGLNYRKIYWPDWTPAPFSQGKDYECYKNYPEIEMPPSFDEMLYIGKKIAENLKYVRTDFYDVNGKMYFGEITLCHGAGFDRFYPEEYDEILGKRLILEDK